MTSLERARSAVPVLLALALALPGAARAQTGAASITGLVTDRAAPRCPA